MNNSSNLRDNFYEKGGTEIVIGYLGDEVLVKNLMEIRLKDETDKINSGVKLLGLIIGVIYYLSKNADNYKKDLIKFQSTAKIIKFSEVTAEFSKIKIDSYRSAINVMEEDEILSLPGIWSLVADLIKIIDLCTNCLKDKINLNRVKINIGSGKDIEVAQVYYNCYKYNLIELLETLNKIAVCDHAKYEIYETYKFKESIKFILMDGNLYEKEYATKVLWQLSFSKKIIEDLSKDEEICQLLMSNKNSKNSCLNRNIDGILWNMRTNVKYIPNLIMKHVKHLATPLKPQNFEKSFKSALDFFKPIGKKSENNSNFDLIDTEDESNRLKEASAELEINDVRMERIDIETENDTHEKQSQVRHIMISYNQESRDTCLKIKSELESTGYKVWIDVENISGSSLESMAGAVENSFCILICNLRNKTMLSTFFN